MMRRSRISVRPNVKPTGRALTASRDTSIDNVQPPQGSADSTPSERLEVTAEKLKTPTAVLERTNEEASKSSSTSDQVEDTGRRKDAKSNGSKAQDSASTSVTSGLQRRKRFTALPNLAKPRASPACSRTPKSPSKSPVKPLKSNESETSTTSGKSSLQIPEPDHNPTALGQRPSGGSRQAKAQVITTASLQNDREAEMQTDGVLEDTVVSPTVQQGDVGTSSGDSVLVDENPPDCPAPLAVEDIVVQQENDFGPTLGQSKTDLLRERLKKLKSPSKILKSLKTLNDPEDMIRLAQARKLRDLLKKEMNKDKEDKKKPKMGIKERMRPKDHTKMTMRELIYYLPASNPMKSFTDDEQKASEVVLDDADTPTSSQTPATPSVQETVAADAVHEEDEERIEETQLEEEEPLLVPRVKVAEDGSLIIDEESLTVQVSRTNGPNPAEDRDPIFERGSTTTYSSFRKGTYTKPWSNGETEMFFLAISMVGTDFSMIGQLFPHRGRLEIKNKFKKEEKNNSWRIDKAFKEKRRLDLDFFKKLMEQMLKDEEKKKNKNKELVKLAKAQRRVHRKVRAAKRKEMDTSEDSDSDVVAGEKENEDLSNDGGSDITPKKRRGRKANGEDQPEDCENVISDGQSQDDRLRESDSSENINKSPAIKPAQLKGRPQRPIPNISRGWGNRRPQPKLNKQEGGTLARDDKSPKIPSASVREKEKKQSTVLLELEDLDEEPDLSAVQEQIFNKPTRSGRIPKLSQHVIQAVAEEEEDEEELSDLPLSSKVCGEGNQARGRGAKVKPGPRLKQGMPRRGKSRLVTLRASGAEDDEEEEQEEVDACVLSQEVFSSNPEEENQAFVPMSLRTLPPVNSEVVETMEELDISVNVPDILGTSQNALCPELACSQASLPAGPVPCEHQLDLLVDVIEFLDPDHMEVCKEINNEAAQTLLTIGNSAQMIQASEMPCISGNDVVEDSRIMHEEIVHEEVITETPIMSDPFVICDSEMKSDVELSSGETLIPETEETPTLKGEPIKSHPGLGSPSVPPPKRGRFSKPKPNVGLRSRRAPLQQISPELATDFVETSKAQSSTEQDKNETQPIQKDSVLVDHLLDSAIHPVLQQDTISERREDSSQEILERLTEEDNGSGTNKNISTEEKLKEQEEAESDSQLTNGASKPQSTSGKPCTPVRMFCGPKPIPDLTQTSRHTHTQERHDSVINEKSSMSPFPKSPVEGAVVTTESDVSESRAQQEATSSIESALAVKDVTQPAVAEDKNNMDENNRTTDDVFEDSNVKLSICESEDTPEEPVFILSLTEIPPTLEEGADFRTEPLLSTAVSHGQSANEVSSKEASHLLITDALVPVSEEEEKKGEGGEVDKFRKGQLKCKTPALTSQGNAEGESHVEVLESPVADDKEHVEKKRKLLERTRRAKLQVKPIPVSRRSARDVHTKEEDTAALFLKDTTSLPTSTPEMRPEQTLPATISTSATISDSDIHSAPEESVQKGPSQGIMGQVDLPVKEIVELASGSDSQGASQITPIGTTGPLTRPGRRPKGFLSFISSKSTQGLPAAPRGTRPGLQRPAVNTTRPERNRIAATAINPGLKRPSPTTEQNSDDEPTSVSKYFFKDIFTEVDELEDMD